MLAKGIAPMPTRRPRVGTEATGDDAVSDSYEGYRMPVRLDLDVIPQQGERPKPQLRGEAQDTLDDIF